MNRLPPHEPRYVLDLADVQRHLFPGETLRVLKNHEMKRGVQRRPAGSYEKQHVRITTNPRVSVRWPGN